MTDPQDAQDAKHDTEPTAQQRRSALRIGLALWLVVAAIVAYVFAWKLGFVRWPPT